MRCAYCHDTIHQLAEICGACGSGMHPECWDEHEECSTLGCEEEPDRDRTNWLVGLAAAACVLLTATVAFAGYPGGELPCFTQSPPFPGRFQWSTLGFGRPVTKNCDAHLRPDCAECEQAALPGWALPPRRTPDEVPLIWWNDPRDPLTALPLQAGRTLLVEQGPRRRLAT